MPRNNNFRRRTSSAGSYSESGAADHEQSQQQQFYYYNHPALNPVDVEIAKRLLSSLLYTKDEAGYSFLHTRYHLRWAKALLDRAKCLDELRPVIDANYSDASSTTGTLLQRRFLLQPEPESGYTPFHKAIVDGNLAAILLFLRHAMDTDGTERLTQRPMTVLHAAEATAATVHYRSPQHQSSSSSNNNNTLLYRMATAVDKEGLTPLKLLGRLQRSELLNCRMALQSYQPQVDEKATIRLRPRQSSFSDATEGRGESSDDEDVDFFSENSDILLPTTTGGGGGTDDTTTKSCNGVTYACEVFTFGRPHHCALGVVQGVSASSAFASSASSKEHAQYTHASTFCPERVQEFAQEVVGRNGSAIAVAAASHHTLVSTKNGHLYSFGVEKGGRLGLGDNQPQQCPLPKRVLGPLQRRQVVAIAAAENHSLCVTKEGTVFSFGSNRFGQLGDAGAAVGSRSVPRRVDDLKQVPCVAVAAGEKHSVALSRKGEVYVWGDNSAGQLGVPRRSGIQKVQRVEALWGSSSKQTIKIAVAIAAAEQSTLVLTAGSTGGRACANSIYEWGHGNHVPIRVHFENGRLSGTDGRRDLSKARTKSATRTNERIVNPVAIACARYHNAALTSDGMVYTWGFHADSLGRSSNPKSTKQQQRRNSSPELVSGLLPENGGGFAVAIAASDQRTAVVCDNGALYTWGTAEHPKNVLGHEGVRWQHLPRQVPGVHRAIGVAVAKEHTVLLIGSSFPSIPEVETLSSLELTAARCAAKHVDLFNVIPILIMAERTECSFLIEYCTEFVKRNLDAVINVGKKTVMNQYLNDMLSDTTFRAGRRYRDDHHHPYVYDILAAGNKGRPTFERDWFSSVEDWVVRCRELSESAIVKRLLALADVREYEEDVLSAMPRRTSSCHSDYEEHKQRARSMSGREEFLVTSCSKSKESSLDKCIKRTANMDLSSTERANENSVWLTKEIRSVRKKLKQIAHLLESETMSVVLSTEQKAKIDRRPALEAELEVYELAMDEVEKRIKELKEECESTGPKARVNEAASLAQTRRRESTPKVSFSDPKTDEEIDEKNLEVDRPASKAGGAFHCELCGVRCSDKSSLLLHQNGRKHKNMAARAASAEEKKVAELILEQQQRAEMQVPSSATPSPSKVVVKNAWGAPSSQPKFKLPPPPHPVVSQVTPKAIRTARRCSSEEVPIDSPDLNFRQILNNNSKKFSKSSQVGIRSPLWDSTPGSTRCVPLSVYGVPNPLPATAPLDSQRGALSLGDFLAQKTPSKPSPSKKGPPAVPWLTPELSTTPHSKSILQIQTEEARLKACQDKSSGSGTSSWFVERRERAGSLLEIQKGAEKELEERLLVEEQFRIEAQIMEENRRQKEEQSKSQKNAAPKKGPRRSQHNKSKPNKQEGGAKTASDSESIYKARGNNAKFIDGPRDIVKTTSQTPRSQTT